ncbi:OHCU decarboxylase [Bradyrhizobium sp. LM3.6]
MSQISLSDLNAADEAGFVAALANVVEYSPWIAGQLATKRPFAGINQLHAAVMAAIQSAEPDVQLALIRAHPDLANKTQRAAGLTEESTDEQNSAGLDRLSEAEYAAFERVNNAYRDKFGIPYIVCVRRHTQGFRAGRLRDAVAQYRQDRDATCDRGDWPYLGVAARSARRSR